MKSLEEIKLKCKEICKVYSADAKEYQITCLISTIILLLLNLILKYNLIFLDVILFLISTLIFFGFKDFTENEITKLYLIQMLLSIDCIFNDLIWGISTFILFRFIIYVTTLILLPILVIYLYKNKYTEFEEKINTINLYEDVKMQEKATGDVVLGYEVESNINDKGIEEEKTTKRPITLPYLDRFLHMLILGPTGCGKTSQIITPMIYTDLLNKSLGLIVLEPKGDLAEKVFALGKYLDRDVIYFNPMYPNCPYFNPLRGDENDVIENLVTTFKVFDSDSKSFFQDNNENLIRRSLKVLKRLYGDDATLNQLDLLVNNTGGFGTSTITKFSKLPASDLRVEKENKSIVQWFLSDYFTGSNGGGRNATKTYENTSGVRNQLSKLISNPFLNKVLNPPSSSELKQGETLNYIDFDEILREGKVCAICSAQGNLRDLGRFLGFFLILQIQSSVFRRPGNEDTRRGAMLYIDEFQVYANPGFSDMLTQGRSYRVGSILATQNRALIGMNSGTKARSFTDLVSTNARNIVIFPGANSEDANYYSREFGEKKVVKEDVSYNQPRFGFGFDKQKVTIRTVEKWEPRFRPTDIIYKKFKRAIVRLIVNNSLTFARVIKLDFIPKEINDWAKEFLSKYNSKYLGDVKIITDINRSDLEQPMPIFEIEEEDVDDLKEFNLEDDDIEDIFDFEEEDMTDKAVDEKSEKIENTIESPSRGIHHEIKKNDIEFISEEEVDKFLNDVLDEM